MLQRETRGILILFPIKAENIFVREMYFLLEEEQEICYNTAYDVLEEIQMKLRYRLAAFLLAAGLVFSNTAVYEVCAAEVEGAAAAVTDEEKAVYEMPVESNALKNCEGPGIFAESGIIMDMNSGAILYAKNIDEKEFPASITKIMTALVALENSELTVRFILPKSRWHFLNMEMQALVCSREKRSQWRMLYMGCCWHSRMKFPMRLQTQWEMGMIILSV